MAGLPARLLHDRLNYFLENFEEEMGADEST